MPWGRHPRSLRNLASSLRLNDHAHAHVPRRNEYMINDIWGILVFVAMGIREL
jgi:hypothetical protein